FFFFSSRRRHTRFSRDWSSDVCSSDLNRPKPPVGTDYSSERERRTPKGWAKGSKQALIRVDREQVLAVDPAVLPADAEFKGYERSEERRVGKECRGMRGA